MDGEISVRSIKNVGSVFTIQIYLGVSEETKERLDLVESMNLTKLRALIVDDDVLVCKSTEQMLLDMGLQAEWSDSGLAAIEKVEKRHLERQDYDTIFVDWKMPDLDGIETTRRIRRIVGPDVTIIFMTAYNWTAFEEQARATAGVDYFMENRCFVLLLSRYLRRFISIRRIRSRSTERKLIIFRENMFCSLRIII